MKICFVHRHYPPEGRGGICTYIATLAHGLADAGHAVHIVARAETGGDRTERDGRITVHRLAPLAPVAWASRGMEVFGHAARKLTGVFANRLLASRRIARKLADLAQAGEIDLIEGAEWEAELIWHLRYAKNRPSTIVKLHGPMEIVREANRLPDDAAFQCLARWEREQTRLADFVASPSRHLADRMAERWGLEAEKIEVIPYPIDAAAFRPGDPDSKAGNSTVLFVGRIEWNKGADLLVDAIPRVLEKHPQTRFRFVGADTRTGEGGGSFRDQLLKRLPESMHSALAFMGPMERVKLIAEYRRATIFAIPSRFDNFPNACLEAMACGTAVVGSDTGGIREMLAPEDSGVLFPPGDSERLAEALTELLSSPDRVREFGQRARRRVEAEYDLEKIVSRTVESYRRILAHGGGE